jgi:hypothetical protein
MGSHGLVQNNHGCTVNCSRVAKTKLVVSSSLVIYDREILTENGFNHLKDNWVPF